MTWVRRHRRRTLWGSTWVRSHYRRYPRRTSWVGVVIAVIVILVLIALF